METYPLITKNNLTLELIDKHLFPIYLEAIQENSFLSTTTRNQIISRWEEIFPNVTKKELKIRLALMENNFWESQEVIKREGLKNKILGENEQMKLDLYYDQSVSIDKRYRVINEINKTTAMISQLTELPPSIEIKIETSAPQDLTMRMNSDFVKDVIDENNSTNNQE